MIEKTLTHYDYIALQVYWSGTQKMEEKSEVEKTFLRAFFSKYQLLVITESEYRREDQMDRIKHIVKNTPDLGKDLQGMGSILEVRSKVIELFNNDLRTLTGLSEEKFPMEGRPVQFVEQATFGMKKREVPAELKKATIKASQREFRSLSKNARHQLLQQEEKKTGEKLSSDEYIRLQADRTYSIVEKFTADTSVALSLQFEAIEERVKIVETKTQFDGDSLVEQVEATKAVQHDVQRLINQTQMGLNWDQIPVKDLPKWLKAKCVSGLKRLAIGTMMLPLRGPAAIINNFIVQPLEIVIEDIGYLKKWLQRILGWTIVAFVIAGVVVIINHPDYEEQRKELKEIYNTAIDYIPVKLVSEPTQQTIKFIWSKVPGQKFLLDIVDVLKGWLLTVPGILLSWFSQLLTILTTFMKDVIINSVKDWWAGK